MNAFNDLWRQIKSSIDEERLAHAYIIQGSPKGDGAAFATEMVQYLFCSARTETGPCGVCDGCVRVVSRVHPDVAWIEPQSKSRQILVDQIDRHILRLHQTSFEGGWKVAGILYADRINDASANKFLKTLEEPPGKSLILLVTDSPEALLPTIRSRCQRINAGGRRHVTETSWYNDLLRLLRKGRPRGPAGALLLSGSLNTILHNLEEEAAEYEKEQALEEDDEIIILARIQARKKETTAEVLRTMQDWYRDVLMCKLSVGAECLHFADDVAALQALAEDYSLAQCYEMVRQVDEVAHRLNRNLAPTDVFDTGLSVP